MSWLIESDLIVCLPAVIKGRETVNCEYVKASCILWQSTDIKLVISPTVAVCLAELLIVMDYNKANTTMV